MIPYLVLATFAAYALIGNGLVVAAVRRGERRRCNVWFEGRSRR